MLLALGSGAPVATTVYRCVGAHGEMVFTGRPCSDAGLAVDSRDVGTMGGSFGARGRDDDGPGADWIGRCADSANELRQRVATAFDSHDVNSLGLLFLWRGMGTREAYRHMRELHALVQQPLAGVDLGGAPLWLADSDGYGALPDGSGAWLRIETDPGVDGGATLEHRYPLAERHACVWLTFGAQQESF
ncbi:MAG TPA: DUF4124 domain-containing protein [Rhodanobacteraceae bacterium]|nr:DUF4124 domain-containing protein [Rhodanobacteraceae bacterium]